MVNENGDAQKELEDFNTLIEILTEPSNEVFVSLNPPFDISFEINADLLDKNISNRKIEKQTFFQLSRKSAIILLLLLQELDEDSIVENFTRNIEDEKELEKESLLVKNELKIVKDKLLNDPNLRLLERYKLKISSKAPSFSSIDWDIKLKINDSEIEEINIPYATCKFEYQREFKIPKYFLAGTRFFDSMQINFSLDEVKYLKRIFANIEKKLEKAEEIKNAKTN